MDPIGKQRGRGRSSGKTPSPPTTTDPPTHPQVDFEALTEQKVSKNLKHTAKKKKERATLKNAPDDSRLNWLAAWRVRSQPKVRLDNVNKELKAA